MCKYAAAAAGAVETLLRKYGKGVIGKEYHQERARRRGDRSVREPRRALARDIGHRGAGDRRRRPSEVRLARAFVRAAKYRMVGHLKEMDKNRDAEQTAIADMAYASLRYPIDSWA